MILVTARPHLLLPTVRSRTQLVAFGRLTPDEIRAALEADGVAPDDAASWARVAGGDLVRARELAAGGAPAKRRALYLDLARAALVDPAFDAGAAASKIDRAAAKRGDEVAARIEQEAAARLDALGDAALHASAGGSSRRPRSSPSAGGGRPTWPRPGRPWTSSRPGTGTSWRRPWALVTRW